MAKTYEGLRADANIIKNEVEVQKNTATRVGTMFVDVIDKMEDSDETQSKLSGVLKVLPTKYSDDDFHSLIDSVTEQAFYQGRWGTEKYMLDCVVHNTTILQCIYGNLNVNSSNTKRLIVSNKYRIIRRHRYEGTWSKWEVIADAIQEGFRRKVLLLGDSQVAMCKSSNYTLEGLMKSELKTDVYNFGFAGSRWAYRDDEGNTQFNAFSVLNVIRTLCSKDYSLLEKNVDLVDDYLKYDATFNSLVSFLQSTNIGDGSDWAIIISAGGNDFAGNTPLSDNGDYTLYGAMGSALSQLCSTFPSMLIHVVSPTFRIMTDGRTSDEYTHWINIEGMEGGGTQLHRYEYGDKILEHARDVFHVPTYDMYRNGGRNAYNIEGLCPDKVHPTSDAGVKSTADIYVKILNTL